MTAVSEGRVSRGRACCASKKVPGYRLERSLRLCEWKGRSRGLQHSSPASWGASSELPARGKPALGSPSSRSAHFPNLFFAFC